MEKTELLTLLSRVRDGALSPEDAAGLLERPAFDWLRECQVWR